MEELHKLWKHPTNHLREMHQRNEHEAVPSCNNNPKFQVGQPVMVMNHTHFTFEPRCMLYYKVMQIPNHSTILLVTPYGKEEKHVLMMLNHVAHWNWLKMQGTPPWGSQSSNQKCTYNLRFKP